MPLLSVGRAIHVSQVLGYWGNLGKLGRITPNQVQGHMKSNPESSAPYFTTNETSLWSQGPLWVELYLFPRYSGVGAIWENWAQILQIMSRDTQKVIESFQHHISH